jgi:hypothetical protein
MAEKIIDSLIYGQHKVPKKSRPWQQRIKVPLMIAGVLLVIGGFAYKFFNYREEQKVKVFLDEVFNGQWETAFADWDHEGSSFTLQDLQSDWGKDGYYTKGFSSAKVIDSNSRGSSVIVYVEVDPKRIPVALMVNKESLKLSYSPRNKYR